MAVSWLKQGEASAQAATQAAAEAELKKLTNGKMYRFYLKIGEEASVTFVDGELAKQGFLLPPRFYEHTLKLNGQVQNYVCPEKTVPEAGHKCPICEQGERSALVALFTIIDHRITKSKDGQKTYQNQRRLLVAKPQSFELLNKLAQKRGGLAGCTFDVSRVGDERSASIGTVFDFTSKEEDVSVLKAKFMRDVYDDKGNKTGAKETFFLPADYEKEIVFLGEDELRKMGFGSGNGVPVSQSMPMGQQQASAGGNFQEHL